MEFAKHQFQGVCQASISGPSLSIIHTKDLLLRIIPVPEPTSADDTIAIISSKSFDDFCMVSNSIVSHISIWFAANKLVLNLDKERIK